MPEPAPGVRLNKRLAELGLASRRAADELIAAGRVRVNGVIVRELGTRVDPERDQVELQPETAAKPALPGLLLNKPVGYVTTKGDGEGPAVFDLLPPEAAGMSYAGRLDKDSRGLVLLLADGRLTYALTDPAREIEKEYLVETETVPAESQLEKMAKGLKLSDGPTRPCRVAPAGGKRYRIWLSEGRNRQVRRMAAKVGLEVIDLQRRRIGPLALGELAEGRWRALSPAEAETLWKASGRQPGASPPPPRA